MIKNVQFDRKLGQKLLIRVGALASEHFNSHVSTINLNERSMVRRTKEKRSLEQRAAEVHIVAHWEKIFKSREWGNYPDISLIRYLSRSGIFAPVAKTRRALELGSGPGANLGLLAKSNFNIWCVDGSETAIAQAKSRLNTEGHLSNLKDATCGQLTEIDYPESFFRFDY